MEKEKVYLEGYFSGVLTTCGILEDEIEDLVIIEPNGLSGNYFVRIFLTERGISSDKIAKFIDAVDSTCLPTGILYDPAILFRKDYIEIH